MNADMNDSFSNLSNCSVVNPLEGDRLEPLLRQLRLDDSMSSLDSDSACVSPVHNAFEGRTIERPRHQEPDSPLAGPPSRPKLHQYQNIAHLGLPPLSKSPCKHSSRQQRRTLSEGCFPSTPCPNKVGGTSSIPRTLSSPCCDSPAEAKCAITPSHSPSVGAHSNASSPFGFPRGTASPFRPPRPPRAPPPAKGKRGILRRRNSNKQLLPRPLPNTNMASLSSSQHSRSQCGSRSPSVSPVPCCRGPPACVLKKRVTFWDEHSVGTSLSLSLHHLCDSFSAGLEDDAEEDRSRARSGPIDDDDDDCDDDDYDDKEDHLYQQQNLHDMALPFLSGLDSEDDHPFESSLPVEIKWDRNSSFGGDGDVPWFLEDDHDIEGQMTLEEAGLPTSVACNKDYSNVLECSVTRLGLVDEVPEVHSGSFLFYTPSADQPLAKPSHLHTTEMPMIPSELSIPLPNLDSDEHDDDEIEDHGVGQDELPTMTPLPYAKSENNEIAKESPTSVLALNHEIDPEMVDEYEADEDGSIQICTKLLATTHVCQESWNSFPSEATRLSPKAYCRVDTATMRLSPGGRLGSRSTRPGRGL